ncbi:MAG: hypothetical protein EU541_01205 [Promethearchaeota archaeon]|nr:MAG: hypothetical protein EU541_01205 [Candidatus Lokiarchaeota archaeon]
MVVIDTDLLVAYLRGTENSYDIIINSRKNGKGLTTTIFNSAELCKGCFLAKNIEKSINKVEQLLNSFGKILKFKYDSIKVYAKISSELKSPRPKGRGFLRVR